MEILLFCVVSSPFMGKSRFKVGISSKIIMKKTAIQNFQNN